MMLPLTQPGCYTQQSNQLEHSVSEAFKLQHILKCHQRHTAPLQRCTQRKQGIAIAFIELCQHALFSFAQASWQLQHASVSGEDDTMLLLFYKLCVGSGKQTRPGCTVHGLHPHQLSNDLGCQHHLIHSDSGVTSPLACVPSHKLLSFPARRARLLCCWCPDLDVMLNACTSYHNVCRQVHQQID